MEHYEADEAQNLQLMYDEDMVSVGDKVIKLREERQLLAHFLVIQQSRPELVPRLPATMGNYDISVTPRSMFVSDGSLLIPTDMLLKRQIPFG